MKNVNGILHCVSEGRASNYLKPLHPLPVIKETHTHIDIDVVGPLKEQKEEINSPCCNRLLHQVAGSHCIKKMVTETIANCIIDLTAGLRILSESLSGDGIECCLQGDEIIL